MRVTAHPGALHGAVRIPGSKSHTIRALLVAAMADGTSTIRDPLDSEDTAACARVLSQLGVAVEEIPSDGERGKRLLVAGRGPTLARPTEVLDCGNSGTTLYLALSLAATQDFPVPFAGDDQLQRRTAGPLLQALGAMGATVEHHGRPGCVPLTITGPIGGGSVTIECPTSQYLSSLLLAAPLTGEGMEIDVPLLNERPYVEITLGWLASQGIGVTRRGWSHFSVTGGGKYVPFDRSVPADFSSATFFLAAAAATRSDLLLHGLDMGDTQGDKAVVEMLRQLGCAVVQESDSLRVRGSSEGRLAGGEIDLNATPDALPAMAVLGTVCETPLRLVNVPQAREKETDRIAVMASLLNSLGGRAEELPDGLVVHPGRLAGGIADSYGDHRVAMALAVAGLCAQGPLTVTNAEVAAVTFPGFYRLMESAGARLTMEDG